MLGEQLDSLVLLFSTGEFGEHSVVEIRHTLDIVAGRGGHFLQIKILLCQQRRAGVIGGDQQRAFIRGLPMAAMRRDEFP